VLRVGRVIGRDGIERAVRQTGAAGVAIFGGAQRRRNLGVGVVAGSRFVGERQVMRRRFGRDADSPLPRLPDQIHGAPGGHVGHVQVGARDLRQDQVSRDVGDLGDRRISGQTQARGHRAFVDHAVADQRAVFRVGDHRRADELRVLEDVAHHAAIHDRLAVVAERHRSRFDQRGHLGHGGALEAPRGGGHRVHAGGRVVIGAIEDEVRHRGVVVDRMRVGHARHRREAARHRGASAAADVFLVLLPRLAQMAVHVDEAGRHPAPLHVEDLGALRLDPPAHLCDAPFVDQDIGGLVAIRGRIENPPSAQENLPCLHFTAAPLRALRRKRGWYG
jgi:hypothetical protein